MHLFFVDESGTPPGPVSSKHKYFVIGGIVIPEGTWHSIEAQWSGLKRRKHIHGEIKWRYFAPGNDDASNPLKHLSRNELDEIRTEIYSKIICGERSIRTMATVCCIEAAYKLSSINDARDLYTGTYKPVSERFQYYLQDLSKMCGRTEYGIIIADHRGKEDDKRLRDDHEKMTQEKRLHTSNYRNIIESLFLQPSHLSVGIQLADMVAGAVWRKFEKSDAHWYDMLQPSLRRGPTGVDGYGIVKFPKGNWA